MINTPLRKVVPLIGADWSTRDRDRDRDIMHEHNRRSYRAWHSASRASAGCDSIYRLVISRAFSARPLERISIFAGKSEERNNPIQSSEFYRDEDLIEIDKKKTRGTPINRNQRRNDSRLSKSYRNNSVTIIATISSRDSCESSGN